MFCFCFHFQIKGLNKDGDKLKGRYPDEEEPITAKKAELNECWNDLCDKVNAPRNVFLSSSCQFHCLLDVLLWRLFLVCGTEVLELSFFSHLLGNLQGLSSLLFVTGGEFLSVKNLVCLFICPKNIQDMISHFSNPRFFNYVRLS